jgi:hypothetical protein
MGNLNIKRLDLWRLLGNIQTWIVRPNQSWRTRMPYRQTINEKTWSKNDETNKMLRILMIVSWQVPKFNCSNAAIKGNGIWDRLQMGEIQMNLNIQRLTLWRLPRNIQTCRSQAGGLGCPPVTNCSINYPSAKYLLPSRKYTKINWVLLQDASHAEI